jgi:hypothetical protein
MLKGQAKTDYQREYMRRRRAGLPTATPKPPKEWKPTQRILDQIAQWISVADRQPWRLGELGRQVLAGLTFEPDENGKIHVTDDIWAELCRRYKQFADERRAECQKEKEEAAKPTPRCRSFCRKPSSLERIMWGTDRWTLMLTRALSGDVYGAMHGTDLIGAGQMICALAPAMDVPG